MQSNAFMIPVKMPTVGSLHFLCTVISRSLADKFLQSRPS